MYYLSNYCSLCLARSENITSLINIELNAQQILDNIIPDYSTNELIPNTEIHIPKQICDICLNSLNNIFKFKQRCLDSIATFTEYVHRLVRDYGPNNFQSVTVDDIPHFKKEENIENFDFDTTESIPNLKSEICETDDGNNVQMETQNEPTSTNFESIEMVSIKVEAPENEFYEEGAIHEETMVKEDDSLETDMPPEDLTEPGPGNSASVEPTNNTGTVEDRPLEYVLSLKGYKKLLHEGYLFLRNRSDPVKIYWKCAAFRRKMCPGRVITEGEKIVKATPHNHPANPNEIARVKAVNALKQKAVESVDTSVDAIISEGLQEIPGIVQTMLPGRHNIKKVLERARKLNRVNDKEYPTNMYDY